MSRPMSQPDQPGLREQIADEIHHARPRHEGCSLCNRIADAVVIALGGGTERCARCGLAQAKRGDTCPLCDLANASDVIAEMRERATAVQADLFDQACAALAKHRERADTAEAERDHHKEVADAALKGWNAVKAERDRLRAAVERVREMATGASPRAVYAPKPVVLADDLLAALDQAPAADSPYATGGAVPGPPVAGDAINAQLTGCYYEAVPPAEETSGT